MISPDGFDAGDQDTRRCGNRRTNNGKNFDAEGAKVYAKVAKEDRNGKARLGAGPFWIRGYMDEREGYSAPKRLKTSEPLVPPKPKLLESA